MLSNNLTYYYLRHNVSRSTWKLNIASLISVGGAVVENLPADLEDTRDMGSVSPWVGKILWSRKWQPLHYLSWKILWTEDTGGL